MRHYEILANGCIPCFIDIDKCPVNTLYLLPKNLLLEANTLYERFIHKTIEDLTKEDIHEYTLLQQQLLEYTKQHLTTNKMSLYILKKTNNEHVSKILYLSGDTMPDYLRCLLLHGFKELLGSKCHDFPKIPHIYKSDLDFTTLYGKGFSYTNLLAQDLHDDTLNSTLVDDIKNKYYDMIIYGSFHRGMPYYELIKTIYNPNEIILICGEDIHTCNCNHYLKEGHSIFIREL
jgi:hypothetical protein